MYGDNGVSYIVWLLCCLKHSMDTMLSHSMLFKLWLCCFVVWLLYYSLLVTRHLSQIKLHHWTETRRAMKRDPTITYPPTHPFRIRAIAELKICSHLELTIKWWIIFFGCPKSIFLSWVDTKRCFRFGWYLGPVSLSSKCHLPVWLDS